MCQANAEVLSDSKQIPRFREGMSQTMANSEATTPAHRAESVCVLMEGCKASGKVSYGGLAVL